MKIYREGAKDAKKELPVFKPVRIFSSPRVLGAFAVSRFWFQLVRVR